MQVVRSMQSFAEFVPEMKARDWEAGKSLEIRAKCQENSQIISP
jgi:hypothetical protein